MATSLCPRCGAEPVAGMNFCRQCGAPVGVSPDHLEQPTSIFNQSSPAQTQRLDPRTTRSGHGASVPAPVGRAGSAASSYGKKKGTHSPGPLRGLIFVGLIIVALLGIGSVAGVMKFVRRSHSQSTTVVSKQADHKSLIYPGARTVLDVTSPTGGGLLQLQTSDDIDKVADWYRDQLKPAKTARVGSMFVLKSGNVSATIVSDSGSTNIMIKQTP